MTGGAGGPLLLIVRAEVEPSNRRELLQALMMWVQAARGDVGVLRAELYEEVETASAFMVVTEWGTQASRDAHLRGQQFGGFLGALTVLARQTRFGLGDTTPDADALAVIQRLRSPVIERG